MDQNDAKPAPAPAPTPTPTQEQAKNARRAPITRLEDLPKVEEIGGPEGPEPTRFGDWSIKGRVSDF